jgi:C4-dicarboxylate-specific signal transduction histidine kinase
MRHFLTSISSFIDQSEPEKAKEYIKDVMDLSDKTARKKLCENEIVNMILSSYESKIKEQGIQFSHTIELPEKLPFSDVDFTSILSNGLENAIHAVSSLPLEKRQISLKLKMKEEKLLLSIRNPCGSPVELINGLPKAMEEGHGLGTRSIRYVTEKLRGNCQFLTKDGEFILRVVL